jgi:hypothetical protein
MVLMALLGNSCVLAPTVLYTMTQTTDDDPQHVREANAWPCGNILHINTLCYDIAYEESKDPCYKHLISPKFEYYLNVCSLTLSYPVSLVFDVLSFPYQIWRYGHLPPMEDDDEKK